MHNLLRLMALALGAAVLILTGLSRLYAARQLPAPGVEKPAREDGLYMTFETEFGDIHFWIFGQCSDLDVVKEIARVPAKDERPLKPVVIKRVDIGRVGPVPADALEAGVPSIK